MKLKSIGKRGEGKRCQLWRQARFAFTFDETSHHDYTFELAKHDYYCPNCDVYFVSEFDFYRHVTWTLQMLACKREIEHITRIVARLGYFVNEQMNLVPQTQSTSSKSHTRATKAPTAHHLVVFFSESTFQQRLRKRQKRLEKLKRQFAAFNIIH